MPKIDANHPHSSHRRNSSFFSRYYTAWSFAEYLSYRHHPSRDPRRVIDSWRPALCNIASCVSKCHIDEQRSRARSLLARFDEKGAGSDRSLGKSWLHDQLKKPTATPGQTINFTPVFNSDVLGSSIAPVFNSNVRSSSVALNDGVRLTEEIPSSSTALPSQLDEDEEDEELDDINEDYEKDDPSLLPSTGSNLVPGRVIEALTATYERQTHRWRLSSGRVVETVLYENCRHMNFFAFTSSLAPSFTIDLDDDAVHSWFEDDEWDEIKKSIPEPPNPPGILAMVRSLRRFSGCKGLAEVREVLATTSFLDPGETYDHERDFLRMWADLVIRNLFVIWASPSCPLGSSQLEDFYSNLVWASIFDQCFLSFPSVTVVRKESPCRSTAARKNRARTLQTRMRQGRRLDGVIRSTGDEAHEFGGMEVARSAAGGVKSTKRLGDANKLLKALRDMLGALCRLVKTEEAKKLQVVGVLCAGLKMQVIRMGCCPEGGVAVVRRQQDVEVPVEVGELEGLTKVLVMVASMKAVVEESVRVVRERHQERRSNVEKSDEELIREILAGPAVVSTSLGWAADTPSPER